MPLNVPSAWAQKECIEMAYVRAGREVTDADFAELHITGARFDSTGLPQLTSNHHHQAPLLVTPSKQMLLAKSLLDLRILMSEL
jgi:hypothetical protein